MVSQKNNWEDFTRVNYQFLLKMALHKYKIGTVADWQRLDLTGLWRHDVDCSPQSALAMAKIEHDEGVCATYYFMLRSNFYNVFEPAVVTIIQSIQAMGHEVGLHFDADQSDVSSAEALELALIKEKNALESVIGVDIRSFSFHNPSDKTAGFKDFSYAGLVNAYSSALFSRFKYSSDSNGYWRFTPLEEFLNQSHSEICVLTHPEWWQAEPLSPRERIARSVEGRAVATLHQYDTFLESAGRKNILT